MHTQEWHISLTAPGWRITPHKTYICKENRRRNRIKGRCANGSVFCARNHRLHRLTHFPALALDELWVRWRQVLPDRIYLHSRWGGAAGHLHLWCFTPETQWAPPALGFPLSGLRSRFTSSPSPTRVLGTHVCPRVHIALSAVCHVRHPGEKLLAAHAPYTWAPLTLRACEYQERWRW